MEILLALTTVAAVAALIGVLARQRSVPREATLGPELAELRGAVAMLSREQGKDASELAGMLGEISKSQRTVAESTGRLSEALRRPAVRGRWGELTLRNVVESAGLVHRVDFDTQAHVPGDAENAAARPDLVVRLPGDGVLPVDAKVPLDGFQDAIHAGSEAEREAALDRHAEAVRAKVRELGAKAYWKRFRRAPELVVMFVASEAAFAAAIERDPGLLDLGFRNHVVLATPATMLALLQAVSLSWREHDLSANAARVQTLATELAARLGVMSSHLSGVGKALEGAVKAHNGAVGSYESRLLVTARQLAELGVGEAAALERPTLVETAPRAPVAELPARRAAN